MLIKLINELKAEMPSQIVGKDCVEFLKENDYNWKQMEWSGWWFDFIAKKCLKNITGNCDEPRYGNTTFDGMIDGIDVDFKTHATHNHRGVTNHVVQCNDWEATGESLKKNGKMYYIVLDIDYDYDNDGSFKRWHDYMKGIITKYCFTTKRISRMRKKSGEIKAIKVYEIDENTFNNKNVCKKLTQGRNSNGAPRGFKMGLNTKNICPIHTIEFS